VLKVLLDEGISRHAVELLAADGVDAVHVAGLGLWASADQEIMKAAREHGRVIFTLDHDYHQIIAMEAGLGPSIVLLRFEHLRAREAANLIAALVRQFESQLSSGVAMSVSSLGVRMKRLPLRSPDPR
jgi:predicted nuclease of predicted toxin-antitoxin system